MTAALDQLIEGLDPLALLEREQRRLDGYFSTIGLEEWARPSRCKGWRVRDVLGHLAASQAYNHACLDDDLDAFLERFAEGAGSLDEINNREVAKRAEQPIDDVLREWRAGTERTLEGMRALPRDATIVTSVGQYPVRYQALHLAVEDAIHADDIGVPVEADERAARLAWMATASRFGLAEQGKQVQQVGDDLTEVQLDGEKVQLADAELVAAAAGRLGEDCDLSDDQREALRVFG